MSKFSVMIGQCLTIFSSPSNPSIPSSSKCISCSNYMYLPKKTYNGITLFIEINIINWILNPPSCPHTPSFLPPPEIENNKNKLNIKNSDSTKPAFSQPGRVSFIPTNDEGTHKTVLNEDVCKKFYSSYNFLKFKTLNTLIVYCVCTCPKTSKTSYHTIKTIRKLVQI